MQTKCIEHVRSFAPSVPPKVQSVSMNPVKRCTVSVVKVHPFVADLVCVRPSHIQELGYSIAEFYRTVAIDEMTLKRPDGITLPSYRSAYAIREEAVGNIPRLNEYLVLATLGTGSQGKVSLGLHSTDGVFVAIKEYNSKINTKEVDVMKKLHHPNVVQIIGHMSSKETRTTYIIMEFVEGGTSQILDAAGTGKPLKLDAIKKYAQTTLRGLEYIHANGILHRDIKPENILITSTGEAKITDFGISSFVDPVTKRRHSCRGGTFSFFAPELVDGAKEYTEAMDIWAFGITLHCWITGKIPFMEKSVIELFDAITQKQYQPPDVPDEDLKDLLCGLLQKDPKKRLTMTDIMVHPYLSSSCRYKPNFDPGEVMKDLNVPFVEEIFPEISSPATSGESPPGDAHHSVAHGNKSMTKESLMEHLSYIKSQIYASAVLVDSTPCGSEDLVLVDT